MGSGGAGLRLVPRDGEDAAARERIRTSLGESLIVAASAGTGKTTELVRRIVAVLAEGADIGAVAAVTFTNKAAGELKLRLRQELDRARAEEESEERRAALEGALAHLEEASIGTIHAFCGQILRERPVEARVDPAFRELTELESRQIQDRAFRAWIQQQLNETSPGLRRALIRLALQPGEEAPLDRLRSAGRALIEWRDYPTAWDRVEWDRATEVDVLAERVRQMAPRVNQKFQAITDLAAWIERSEAVGARDYDTLEALLLKLLRDLTKIKAKGAEELAYALEQFRVQAEADLAHALREEMTGLVERYEELKRQAGLLDFHDLLLKARDLVRDNREVREFLQRRFSHIFVDEFQDTDPVQAELLLLLSSADAAGNDWLEVTPTPGKLFLVGDPKQSIYKFRRADVVLYSGLRDRLRQRGVGVVRLTRSFRSVRPIQQLVNAAFAPEMTGDAEAGQAEYSPLEEVRRPITGQPSVVALPAPRPYGMYRLSKIEINNCLPDTIGAYVEWLIHESGWQVEDPDTRAFTPISARHICLLFRRFTSFGRDLTRDYTRSLEARGIPHLLVGSRSFHAREEVETLRAALAAVEWPGDELSVFAALKGSLFAIPDALLLEFRLAHKRLSPYLPGLDQLDAKFAPIREALELLRELHRQRNWRPVAATVHQLLEFTRAHAGFALRPGGQQVLANVYRVADVARGYESEGGISFRGFVEMLEAQVEKAESSEAPVLEEGSEGVRMMTVHAAKGLEFPVVILADMTANLSPREPDRYVDSERHLCAMRLLQCTPWPLLQHRDRELAREQAEGVRVAYVAATRARDLLVVPAVGDEEVQDSWLAPLWRAVYPEKGTFRRSEPQAEGCPRFGESTVLSRPPELNRGSEMSVRPGVVTPAAGAHRLVWWDPGALKLGVEANYGFRQEEVLAGDEEGASLAAYEAWRARRETVAASGAVPAFTIFSPSEAIEAPPGTVQVDVAEARVAAASPRTFGSHFGVLLHVVMRDIDFRASRDAIEAQVELQGRIMGAPDEERAAAVEAVAAALAHPLLRAAAAAPRVHREWPVRFRAADGRLLEGIVDLAYFDGAAWHIVDYKTDADFHSRRRHYETQLRWYVQAAAQLTNQSARGWLLRV
ncbi:MAG: UvrD-helicase domain-containing protein [Bryobacterales bacterium]|nr:UvrD-helicase domain-containing protein [Bryobacterales bacterium]